VVDKLNPWLESAIKKASLGPEMLPLMVEVADPSLLTEVVSRLSTIPYLSVKRQAFNYVEIMAVVEAIPAIERIPGVKMVHKSMIRKITAIRDVLPQLPHLAKLSMLDHLEGEIRIDNVVCPRDKIKPDILLPFSPLRFIKSHGPSGEVSIIPTSQVREFVLDVTTQYTGRGVKIALLDTGAGPQNPQTFGIEMHSVCSTDPQPFDLHGHGSWLATAAGGKRVNALFGQVQGVATGAHLISIKTLHGIFGFGSDMDVMKGIEKALDLGAKVICLSLGGDECQGGELNCPLCKLINKLSKEQGIIFCVAASNSGPDPYTIGCPGCAIECISVGAVSMTDSMVSWWSSRGPQNKANTELTDVMSQKPDVVMLGGGRASPDVTLDEVIYSGEEGWCKPMYTGTPFDVAGCFHGSSQATPIVAGLVAILLEAGKVTDAASFKSVCQLKGHVKTNDDGWGVPKLSWFDVGA
jgi:subtilisin family serine protease